MEERKNPRGPFADADYIKAKPKEKSIAAHLGIITNTTTIVGSPGQPGAPGIGYPGPPGEPGVTVVGPAGPPGESIKGDKGDKGEKGDPGSTSGYTGSVIIQDNAYDVDGHMISPSTFTLNFNNGLLTSIT